MVNLIELPYDSYDDCVSNVYDMAICSDGDESGEDAITHESGAVFAVNYFAGDYNCKSG